MAGQVIVETAPAKLNLALHVRRRRDDGYHELETIFAFARDGDTLTVVRGEASLRITGPFAADLSNGPDNLVLRAEGAFKAAFGIGATHAITLDKHLPIASGIGGGSADAAATLRALARLHGIGVHDDRLFALAASLGADVPACLLGHAALGSGKGDALEKIAGLGDMPALLVNPGVGVSTAAVFARWDRHDRGALPDGDTLERAIGGRNDLQLPAEQVAPVIAGVVSVLTQQSGVRLARMSGSGATCFALFETASLRDAAALAIAAAQPDWWLLTTTVR